MRSDSNPNSNKTELTDESIPGRRDLVDFADVDEDLSAREIARLDAHPRLGRDIEGGQEGWVGRGQDRRLGGRGGGGKEPLRLGVDPRRRRQNLETPVQDAAVDLEPGRLEDPSVGAAVHGYFFYHLYTYRPNGLTD